MSAKFPGGGGVAGPFLARSLLCLVSVYKLTSYWVMLVYKTRSLRNIIVFVISRYTKP